MATQHWDAIIFGAGPAGLALAQRLQASHCRALVIEKRASFLPGLRIGESLPGAASVLLHRLGLMERFLSSAHRERGATVSVWDEEIPVWRDGLRDPAGPGWHLDRNAFDQLLREGALEAGASFLTACRPIKIERHAQTWQVYGSYNDTVHASPILVDATGRNSALTRRFGISRVANDNLLCVYNFLNSRADDDDATMRLCADDQGWWYTVQIPHGKRVLAYHLDTRNPLWRQWKHPADFLNDACRQPVIAEVIESLDPAPLHYRPAGTAILDVAALGQTVPGMLAVGDALLCFDPVSSQGIFHSLASAESAATTILADFPANINALLRFKEEMQAVSTRYLKHLKNTYQGPRRFSHCEFWAKRKQ